MDRIEPMIEQVHQLYNMYFTQITQHARADTKPPVVQRDQLAAMMQTLSLASKPTPALRFRAEGLRSKYTTYRDQWEKKLKKLEASGKR